MSVTLSQVKVRLPKATVTRLVSGLRGALLFPGPSLAFPYGTDLWRCSAATALRGRRAFGPWEK